MEDRRCIPWNGYDAETLADFSNENGLRLVDG